MPPSLTAFAYDTFAQVVKSPPSSQIKIYNASSNVLISRYSSPVAVTCMSIIQLSEGVSEKKSKKRSRTSQIVTHSKILIALCLVTKDNVISLLSLQGAIVKSVQADTDIAAFTICGDLLWCLTAHSSIVVYNLHTLQKTATIDLKQGKWATLLVIPSLHEPERYTLILGSNTLTIYECDLNGNSEQVASSNNAGHTSAISHISLHSSTESSLQFATSSSKDRYASLWNRSSTSDSINLVAQLTLSDPISQSFTLPSQGLLGAITESGQLAISSYSNPIPSKKSKVVLLNSVFSVKGDIIRAHFEQDSNQVDLVRGISTLKPVFESIDFRDMDGHLKQQQLELTELASVLIPKDGDGDINMGAPNMRIKHTNANVAKSTSAAPITDSLETEDLLMEQATTSNPGNLEVEAANEPSLADRLKALQVERQATAGPSGTSRKDDDDLIPIPSNSLTTALIQALHSSDTKLLESCLVHSKSAIVKNTVKRLPTHLVVPLVDALVERLARGRRANGAGSASAHATRARALIAWLKCVLVVHIAHLISIPGLVDRLSSLYKTIQARLELQEPLLQLSGRLELVVSQIELKREAAVQQKSKQEALVHYIEGQDDLSTEESEGEIEDVMIQDVAELTSDSEQSHEAATSDDDDEAVSGFLDLEASESEGEEDEDAEYDLDQQVEDLSSDSGSETEGESD